MNDLSTALLPILWRASWQGAIAIALVWGVCRAAEQRIPASLRCTLYRLTYLKLLLGLLIAGGFALPLLRPASPEVVAAPTAPIVAAVPAIEPTSSLPSAATVEAPTPTPYATPVATVAANPTSPNAFSLSSQSLLAAAYGVGLLICLIRLARALLRTRNILRSASPMDESDNKGSIAILHELAATLGLRRVPRLAESTAMMSPAYVAGTVLLPVGADYSPDALRLILAHELAHARRRDLTYEWLGVAAQTLFFFHPLVYLARREERLARESAADALALQATAAPAADFGALLLSLATNATNTAMSRQATTVTGAIGVFEGGGMLHRRLLALKQVSEAMPTRRKITLLLAGALLILIPWRMTHASPRHVAPNIDIIQHSARYPDIPHGTHRIVGQVRDDAGNPAHDVLVGITPLPVKLPYTPGAIMPPTRIIHADATGKYDLTDLPEGHYGITVTDATAFVKLSADPLHRRSAVGRFAPTQYETTIRQETKPQTLDLTATSGVTLSGRVLNQATGQPMPNIHVLGNGGPSEKGGTVVSSDGSITDGEGRYFLRLLPGQVSARLMNSGTRWDNTIDKEFPLSLGQSATYDFHVALPGSTSIVPTAPVALPPSPSPASQTRSQGPPRGDIVGYVRSGETGKPAPNLAIKVETEAKGADGKPVVAFSTRSDAAGNFAVTQIPTGRYKVSIDDYTETSVELAASDTTKKVSLTYIRPATISGKFTKANGKPNGGIAMMGWTVDNLFDRSPPNQQNVQNVTIRYTGWEDGRYKMELRAGDVVIGSYSGELDDGRGKKSYLISNGKRLPLAPGQTATLDFAIDQTRTHR